jgi:hypothetical protein
MGRIGRRASWAAVAALAVVVLLSAVGLRSATGTGDVGGADHGEVSVLVAGDTVGTPAPAVRSRAWSEGLLALLRWSELRYLGYGLLAGATAGIAAALAWWRRSAGRGRIGRPLRRATVAPCRAPPTALNLA